MASGTISKSYSGYTLKSEWSSQSDTAGNYSDVTVNHYLVCKSGYDLYIGSRANNCTCGESKDFTSSSISTPGDQTIYLGTTTHRVGHNSDGTKTVNDIS